MTLTFSKSKNHNDSDFYSEIYLQAQHSEKGRSSKELLKTTFLDERPQLLRIALGIVKNESVAEEITQDAYVRICGSECAAEIRNHKAYCCQVVRNIALDTYRKSSKNKVYESEEDVEISLDRTESPWQTPEQSAYFNEVFKAVLSVLAQQPEHQQKVFLLHFTENLTQREIAAELGCSPASVNIYLRKVRQALMRCEICRAFIESMAPKNTLAQFASKCPKC